MKKKASALLALCMISFLFSCDNSNQKLQNLPEKKDEKSTFDPSKFVGEYVGNFGDGHIVITISYLQGKNVSGFNLHKGLRRNIKGNVEEENGQYHFVMKEPGDHQYDGVFDFVLNPESFTGSATWTPNDKNLLKEKKFSISKRERIIDVENLYVGFWDGAEMLEIKPDGIALLTYYVESEKLLDNSPKELRGQWIVENETLTVEWPSNSYTKSAKYVLKRITGESGETLLSDGKGLEFYQY